MGRPAGSTNVRATATTTLSRCPSCDSTEREVLGKTEQEYRGREKSDGTPYTHIVRRRVRCECGQIRIDLTYENRNSMPERK